MGHSSQQINVSAHVSIWYAVAAIVLGAKPLSEKASRLAFLLYILFLQLASAHHLLVEPGMSSEWKIFNTSYAMYLAVLGSMIHAMTVPGTIEAAQRKRGFNKGMFEWLRKAPWGNPAFSGVFLSLVMFGFLGGISGVVMGTEQINLIMHNTLYVPGHFHATVVAGTTLTFMAVTYLLIPLIFQREVMFPRLAQWQTYVFAIGVSGISLFMMGAGTLGVPRRHWDVTFSDAIFPFQLPSAAFLMLTLNGIFAVLAATGGADVRRECRRFRVLRQEDGRRAPAEEGNRRHRPRRSGRPSAPMAVPRRSTSRARSSWSAFSSSLSCCTTT